MIFDLKGLLGILEHRGVKLESGDEVALESGFETHHGPVLATRDQAGNASPIWRDLPDTHNGSARDFIAPPIVFFERRSVGSCLP